VSRRSDTRSATPHRSRQRRKSPLWARLLVLVGVFLMLGSTGVLASVNTLANRYDKKIGRDDPFAAIPAGERGSLESHTSITGPMNILVVGLDNTAGAGDRTFQKVYGQRSDTIMLFHIPKSMDRAYAISFPRDSYVDIPAQPGKWDGGKNKINSAFEFGGAPLLIRTVQDLTGLRVDHVLQVDFQGLHKMTDAVGGVDVFVQKTTRDGRSHYVFPAGWNHLDANKAEIYVRQRYGLAEGDFDRVKRQQQYLHALLKKATDAGMITDPVKLDRLLTAATESVTVDKDMRVKDLAFALRGLRVNDVTFITLPFAGYLSTPFGDANKVDEVKAQQLFTSIKDETIDQYLLANPPNDASKGR
jgi:LCP family protein required for cell wall assembly